METNVNFKECKCCGRTLPIYSFKMTRYGERVSVCTECATKKMRENKEKKRIEEAIKAREQAQKDAEVKTALSSFTPRQLMEELKRRGYRGKLEYIETHVIDLEKI